MDIEKLIRTLRVNVRKNSKIIMNDVKVRHILNRSSKEKSKIEICIFCGTQANLTKEHVLPRWVFGKCSKEFFITDLNKSEQTYNKTTVPACANCNNHILAGIENYIIDLLKHADIKEDFFAKNEIQNIIRWLEIIEYKFQILEIRRKFIRSKEVPHISFFRDIPISVMRENIGYSPYKALVEIRGSLIRLSKRDKSLKQNSLVLFTTKNKSFYFFHKMDDFIYLELPEFEIALFYFYHKIFNSPKEAFEEAMNIIKSVYNS